MFRHKWLWSAALTILAAANCATAQPAPAVTEGSDRTPARQEPGSQPAQPEPQPAFSRKARLVFIEKHQDDLEPAPEYSRAVRVVMATR